MKHTISTLILAFIVSAGFSQQAPPINGITLGKLWHSNKGPDGAMSENTTYLYTDKQINELSSKFDTIAVYANCLDTVTLQTSWHKMYGVSGWTKPVVNFNGLVVYQEYLMPDRKTQSIYKVIYSINVK